MPPLETTDASVSRLEQTLRAYDEPLLRHVAEKLLRPRGQWPVSELIERCQAAFDNIAMRCQTDSTTASGRASKDWRRRATTAA